MFNKKNYIYILAIILLLFINNAYAFTLEVGSADDNKYLEPQAEVCHVIKEFGVSIKLSCTTVEVNSINGSRLPSFPVKRLCAYKENGQICVYSTLTGNSECPHKKRDIDEELNPTSQQYDGANAVTEATATDADATAPPAPTGDPIDPTASQDRTQSLAERDTAGIAGSIEGCTALPLAPSPPEFCQYLDNKGIVSGTKVLIDPNSTFFDPKVIVEMSYGDKTQPFGPGSVGSIADKQTSPINNRGFQAEFHPRNSHEICVKEKDSYIGCVKRPDPKTLPTIKSKMDGNILKFDINFGNQNATIYELEEFGSNCALLYGVNFCAYRMCDDASNQLGNCTLLGDTVCVMGFEQYMKNFAIGVSLKNNLEGAGFCAKHSVSGFSVKNTGTYKIPKAEVKTGGTTLKLETGSPSGIVNGIKYYMIVKQDPITKAREVCVSAKSDFIIQNNARLIDITRPKCFTMQKPPESN